jgi:hypothetical protein
MSRSFEKLSQKNLLYEGVLFHKFNRYVQNSPQDQQVDRLKEILENGLVPPGLDATGRVISDLNLEVKGTSIPYDEVVFLHKFDPHVSFPYTFIESGGAVVVLDDEKVDYKSIDHMEAGWPFMSRDEVYVHGKIPAETLGAIAVHGSEIEAVHAEFNELSLPLYDHEGKRRF